MSLSAFDQLYAEFEVAHAERLNASRVTRRKRQTRANERWGLAGSSVSV
jgi:hypothetical protein